MTAAGDIDSVFAIWRPRHNPWVVALTVTLATFMEVLDTSIANVALPHIAGSLSAGVDESTWVLTSYLVSNAIVLPLSAWLSEVFGRKRFYMSCVALFTISSALCGVAPTLGMLIFFRVVQGAGGGGLQPSEQAILADTFPPRQRGMAFAVYGIAVVCAPALGPTLGGWITDNYSWRWLFYINVPVGLFSLFMTSLVVEDPPHARARRRQGGLGIDYIGLGLVAVALGSLQVVLDRGQEYDWFGSRFIVVFSLLAVVGLVVGVIWEVTRRDPIVDLHLLKERHFATAFFLMFGLGFVLLGSTVLLPLFLQTIMGYTATQAGLALTWGALVIMALMPVVGLMLGHIHARWLVVWGLLSSGLGLWLLARLSLDSTFWQVSLYRVVQASGLAFLFAPINVAAYVKLPPGRNNAASALLNVARNIGGSVGIAVATTIMARRAQVHQNFLISHLTPYDPAYLRDLSALSHTLAHYGGSVGAPARALVVLYSMVQQQAAVLAVADAFRWLGAIFLLLIPVVWLFKPYDPRGAHAGH